MPSFIVVFQFSDFLIKCRDDDHSVEQWTTVDPNRTNVRDKGVQKLLPGFSLYVVLMGKNQPYESKIEERWRHTLIVCTVMASSGPVDTDGMLYLSMGPSSLHNGARNPVESIEDSMDAEVSRKGVVRNNKDQKTRSKVHTYIQSQAKPGCLRV